MSALVIEGAAWEDSGTSLMCRLRGVDGDLVARADLSSIAYSVFDEDDTDAEPDEGTLTVADVVYDTLQTDSRWTKDGTGYNFRWDTPAALLADGGRRYRFEVKFTPVSGEPFHVVWRVPTGDLRRS